MTPQDQQHIDPKTGDCFRCCVASILDLSWRDVPNFMEHPGDAWWTAVQEWLAARNLRCEVALADDYVPPGYWIASGKSPRGDYHHAVVMHGCTVAHDPHPSRAGLDGPPKFCFELLPSRKGDSE